MELYRIKVTSDILPGVRYVRFDSLLRDDKTFYLSNLPERVTTFKNMALAHQVAAWLLTVPKQYKYEIKVEAFPTRRPSTA